MGDNWIQVAYAVTADGDGHNTWRCDNLGGDNAAWVEITPREWAEMRCEHVVACFREGTVFFCEDIALLRAAIMEVMADCYPDRQFAFMHSRGGSWISEVGENNLADIFGAWYD